MTRIIVTRDNATIREVTLTNRDLRVGRSSDNDIVLEDASKAVSRAHAELRHEAGNWVLLDLNSQNGIWTNGARQPRIVLQPGVPAVVGPYQLTLMSETFDPSATIIQAPATTPTRAMNETAVFVRPTPGGAPTPASGARPASYDTGRAPSSGGPLAALFRLPRPVLFGGFAAVAVGAVLVTSMLRPSAQTEEPTNTAIAETTPEPAPAPVASDAKSELISQHLAEGEQAILEGRLESAIADHLERVLLVDPQNEQALTLKARAQKAIEARRAAVATAAPPAPAAAPSRTPSPATTPAPAPRPAKPAARPAATPAATTDSTAEADPEFPRRPGETPTAWRARGRALNQRFASAEAAARRGNHIEAVRAFDALLRDEPAYPGVRAALEESRRGVTKEAEALVAEGKTHEDAGQLAEAAGLYQRALTVAPTLAEADARLAEVRRKLQAEAETAYTRARQYDALTRVKDAIREYEAALAGLAADDGRRSSIEERLAILKRPPLEERR